MPVSRLNKLWRAIDVLEAQEHIAQMRAAGFPYMKKEEMKERQKKLYNAAYPRDIYRRETKDVSFLADKLNGGK